MAEPIFGKPDPSRFLEGPRVPLFLADARWRNLSFGAWVGLLFILSIVLLGVGSALTHGLLLDPRALGGMLRSNLPLFILSAAMVVPFSRGGIDLSVGSVMALTAATAAGPDFSASRGLLAALACGAVNALLVGLMRLPGLLATFITMMAARFLALVVSGGRSVAVEHGPWMDAIGPLGWIVLAGVAAAAFVTVQLPLLGGKEARRQEGTASDLPEGFTLGTPYLVSGLLAGFAGLYYVSLLSAASPSVGSDLPFRIVVALLLGGSWFRSGYGNVIGTLLAAAMVGTFGTAMMMLNLESALLIPLEAILLLLGLLASFLFHLLLGMAYRSRRTRQSAPPVGPDVAAG